MVGAGSAADAGAGSTAGAGSAAGGADSAGAAGAAGTAAGADAVPLYSVMLGHTIHWTKGRPVVGSMRITGK